jgi:hypothetical protein
VPLLFVRIGWWGDRSATFEIDNQTDSRITVTCWLYEEENVWWTRAVEAHTTQAFSLPAVTAEIRSNTTFPDDMSFSVRIGAQDKVLSTSSLSLAPRDRGRPFTLVVEDTKLIFKSHDLEN